MFAYIGHMEKAIPSARDHGTLGFFSEQAQPNNSDQGCKKGC